ncbi:TPA: hypothetical protein RXT57_003200 [Escherichia coli]|jgi:hypothetical protein|uniref:hypothetical protein n=1 Tax=Escherichia coli TaxID=562 RepID=UPI001B845140|nr:hypothetical protein [Escherichia coli]HDL8830332.1 hypothetical protein [Escherichia coli]HEA9272229.1 hypothetical protein [Escherichia coli]
MLVAINYHLLSRRLKTPTSYRQATEAPTCSRPATEAPTCSRPATATFHFDALFVQR